MAINKRVLNDKHNYGLGLVAIHWFMALGILGLYPLGLYMLELDYYDPAYQTYPHWHKSIGILIAGLLLTRIVWRTLNKPPAALPQPPKLELIAKLIHGLLYLLVLITVISGYLISTADGNPISFFSFFDIPALPAAIENQEDIAGEVHYYVATTLVVIAGLHALAALKHHFIDKDSTLKRIFAIKEEH